MGVPGNENLDAILNSVQNGVKNVFSPLEISIRKVSKDFGKSCPGLNDGEVVRGNKDGKFEQSMMKVNAKKKSRTNEVVKNVFLPLETSIRKVAKDFEKCWSGLNNRDVFSGDSDGKFEQSMMEINAKKKSRSNEVVNNMFLPLETSIRKVAKDFEKCWPGLNDREGRSRDIDNEVERRMMEVNENKKSRMNGFGYSDDRNKYLVIKLPEGMSVGLLAETNRSEGVDNKDVNYRDVKLSRKGLKWKYGSGKCLNFSVSWSVLINGFVQAFPFPFMAGKKRVESKSSYKPMGTCGFRRKGLRGEPFQGSVDGGLTDKEENDLSFEYLLGFLVDELTKNLQQLDTSVQEGECKRSDHSLAATTFDHWKVFTSILEGKKADLNGFFQNLNFARVGGVPSGMVGITSDKEESDHDLNNAIHTEERGSTSAQKLANDLLSIPLSNVERLRSTLSTVSLTELIELLPQLGRSSQDHPDKKKLISVQDFFRYTETEGRRFFEELDRDGDGRVNLEDLEVAMRKRKLPRRYAREFMHRARRHLFSKSFGWKQFSSLIEQKEPTILRAYTSLCLSKSGTLQRNEIMASLKNAGLPANEDNAVAMMRFLNSDTEESISYGHFRNFMLLLPSYRLQEDPRCIWFESATVVAVAPPVEIPTGSFLKSALAGGLACALSTSLLYPVDTIKTQVQASTLSFPEIISKVPQLGVRGLYRGSIPAIWGQFTSHGLRTGIFEATKLVLVNIAPRLPELQVQSVASFCGTFVGTAIRIPCEVLKQRLQAGLFENVGDAVNGTWQQDGLRGFFRGTGATLFREIPFYVVGMGLYAESKKAVQQILRRELEPWETITVGAVSGGISAVLTTPFDVIKTRMMTAPLGKPVSLSMVAFSILRLEGPLGLFKGAIPRFFWIAPLGAMNFAGYELAKKAMEKDEGTAPGELDSEK